MNRPDLGEIVATSIVPMIETPRSGMWRAGTGFLADISIRRFDIDRSEFIVIEERRQ
jgi:hypothetical protein